MSYTQEKENEEPDPLPKFDVVLPMTRRAQVAETLRNFILSGQLAPGTQLVEAKLSSRFGVSRGSIREAIWELIDQGLLVNRPYAGAFVVSLDDRTMSEVFSVRGAIERHAFTQLWSSRDAQFRKEFGDRCKTLVKAIRTGDNVEAIKAEIRFHSYPYEFSNNTVLLEVWEQLSQKIHLSFVMSQASVRGLDFVEEAERYYAVAIGDSLDEMLAEIDRHLELGLIAVKRSLETGPFRLHGA
ncbi:MAG: GntR family transcriptional regulator [Rhizobiaceae bacterium]|nr:GntR family transcriptional regulator [Rhizobiaceae bacterium]